MLTVYVLFLLVGTKSHLLPENYDFPPRDMTGRGWPHPMYSKYVIQDQHLNPQRVLNRNARNIARENGEHSKAISAKPFQYIGTNNQTKLVQYIWTNRNHIGFIWFTVTFVNLKEPSLTLIETFSNGSPSVLGELIEILRNLALIGVVIWYLPTAPRNPSTGSKIFKFNKKITWSMSMGGPQAVGSPTSFEIE